MDPRVPKWRNKGKWKLFFDHYLGKYGGKQLFRSNLKQQDSTLLNLNRGGSRGEGAGGAHPPSLRWSFLLRIYVFAFKFFLPHRQWRHSLEVHPLLRKILDPPLLKDPFLKEIIQLQYWTTFNYKDDNLDFASTYIWYNSHIRIENRPFFYRSWWSAVIKEIRDLLDNDQNFLSYNTFIDKYSIKTNYLE